MWDVGVLTTRLQLCSPSFIFEYVKHEHASTSRNYTKNVLREALLLRNHFHSLLPVTVFWIILPVLFWQWYAYIDTHMTCASFVSLSYTKDKVL